MMNDSIKILFLLFLLSFIPACNTTSNDNKNELRIPELIDTGNEKHVRLILQKGEHEFYPGIKSNTMGINSNYLGPSIKLHKDTIASIQFTNNIYENTTVHGHGLHVAGNVDGGPQQVIKPGKTWEIKFPVTQEAGMSWYHPHLMGKTAEHVHAGLAGLYLIEDENSQSLNIPKTYGVDDIPLIVQDRSFSNGRMRPYKISHEQMMDGLREDTLIVNGTVNPYHITPKGWVRLRLLNGSNARFYRFYFENNISFYKIATEGGFLNSPVMINELEMAPGERNEIMLDLSNIEAISLMAEFLPADPEDQLFFMQWLNTKVSVIELRTSKLVTSNRKLPKRLNNIDYYYYSDKDKAVVRHFNLDMDDDSGEVMNMHNMFTINGNSMDMSRIDEQVKLGELEVWSITADMMPHPFHIHGVSFQILQHQGQPPAESDRGWKDTVVVGEEPTEVIMRFNHIADKQTPYMYHCHILEHEDGGMMGQFTVQ